MLGAFVVSNSLQDLTKAFLALEGLLQSRFLSHITRQQLELFRDQLNHEISEIIRRDMQHGKVGEAAAGS